MQQDYQDQKVLVEDFVVFNEDLPLFDPLSFTLDQGQCLHISGANGIGKTKLLEALFGLHKDHSGKKNVPKTISYLSLKQPFDDHQTVLKNLEFWQGIYQTKSEIASETFLKNAPETVLNLYKKLSLVPLFEKKFKTLSAGQKQKVHFARHCLQTASLWLLDEPFSFLDNHTKSIIQSMIQEFCQKGGMCILTHHGEDLWANSHDFVTRKIELTVSTNNHQTSLISLAPQDKLLWETSQ